MHRIAVATGYQARPEIVPVTDRVDLGRPVFLDLKRIAGTRRENAVHLPAFHEYPSPAVHAFESRNSVGEVRRERMTNVEGRRTTLQRHVPGIVAALSLHKVIARAGHAD